MTSERIANSREDIHFRILQMVEKNPLASQRQIASALGVSLGRINYCLNALINKGMIKIENFTASPNKLGYLYVLTPEGISHRASLMVRFIRRKTDEYEMIKAELEALMIDLQGNELSFSQASEGDPFVQRETVLDPKQQGAEK
jgi:EPS-associated MarR family transcriptional regulator